VFKKDDDLLIVRRVQMSNKAGQHFQYVDYIHNINSDQSHVDLGFILIINETLIWVLFDMQYCSYSCDEANI
jgi:hypothetical protein